ncbi:MAG: prenyltransferase [Nitrospirota bacterium]|nr:prenyltransferase [Nitrospirota bacterium]
MKIRNMLGPMRLPFLILPPTSVLLGLGVAVHDSARIDLTSLLLALLGSSAALLSINALNEYEDFRSGLDLRTDRTPFSGGSGTLPAMPEMASKVLGIGVIALLLTILVGLYLVYRKGLMLLSLGLPGVLIIISYTRWITGSPAICLVAPGLGLGPIMVMGTYFVLTGTFSWTAFAASLPPFFQASNLLLLNQFPDVEADRIVGRRHLPIVFGRRAASIVFCIISTLAYLSIVVGVYRGVLPRGTLLGMLALALALPAALGTLRNADDIPNLIPAMGLNIAATVATPVLVAIGFFL